ncbi:MAG: zinc ribbon domain-containing protein [Sedimentisphaerales bacterium]|jgi:hypothetical protein
MKEISGGRKTAYYIGMMIVIIGFLTFGSVFVSGIQHNGDFSNFRARSKSMETRAITGMCLIVVGGIVMGIGARGAAGSGLVLDPKKAREDLEPYARMGGGMLKDALDEADIHLGKSSSEKVIMIKCRNCQKLNEEDSKFCQECGKPL